MTTLFLVGLRFLAVLLVVRTIWAFLGGSTRRPRGDIGAGRGRASRFDTRGEVVTEAEFKDLKERR